jgi:glycosyltransferase involved in cell wall biosynthesis
MLLYRQLFIPLSIRKSDTTIAISNSVKNEISSHFPKYVSRLEVIYNAIAVDRPDPKDASERPPSVHGDGFFLIPSALLRHKNIANLVKAIDVVYGQLMDTHFVFTGPYDKAEFKYERVPDNCTVLGYVDKTELGRLYTNALGILLPSVYEGFGMPYIEAILANKAIIASDIPIARELLGEYATYIKAPYSVEQIAEAILRFKNGERMFMPAEYRERLVNSTRPIHVARQYISEINQLSR